MIIYYESIKHYNTDYFTTFDFYRITIVINIVHILTAVYVAIYYKLIQWANGVIYYIVIK